MAGIGIVLAWFGYSVFYHGLNTVTGGNESFMSLIWPGRYSPVPRDAPKDPGNAGIATTDKGITAALTQGNAVGPTPGGPDAIANSGQVITGVITP